MRLLRSRRLSVLRRRGGNSWRVSGGEGRDNFGGGRLADVASTIVNTALRKRVLAAAGAGFRVEFVERNGFLFRREFR